MYIFTHINLEHLETVLACSHLFHNNKKTYLKCLDVHRELCNINNYLMTSINQQK